jgi:hypothetical protein
MANTSTLSIKAKLANHIRKTLYAKKRLEQFSQDEKTAFFNEVYGMYLEMHSELNAYKSKRKYKKQIHEARVKRGYNFKKKTPLKKYLESSK